MSSQFSGNMNAIGANSRSGIYSGTIEEFHPDFLKNGLLKVRIPVLHYETNISYVPYANLVQSLLSWCNCWNEPTANQNKAHLVVKGKSKIDGNLELKNMAAGGYMVAMATVSQAPTPYGMVGFGSPASGPTQTKGNAAVDGNGEFDLNTDDYDTCEITPKQYDLRPYNVHRQGEDLLRVGDSVLVVSLMGQENNLVVVDILSFASEGA